PWRGFFPIQKQRINAKACGKSFIATKTVFPNWPFEVVERRIGHVNFCDSCKFHAVRDVILDTLAFKPIAEGRQIAFLHIEAQRMESGENAAASLGKRRVLEKKMIPNQVGLPGF